MHSRPDVIIAGGGIAGITAALRLADAGLRVELLESRDRLGGRASSFQDARTGEWLDNCQHVTLGCCARYRALCARLGVAEQIRWDREQYWIEAGGRESVLGAARWPAPLHGLPGLLRAAFLTLAEKAAVARALAAAMITPRAGWAGKTFAEFLAEHDQPAGVISKFWSPVIVSACNLSVERVAATTALHVFQEGFLRSAEGSWIGIMTIPLVRVYDVAAAALQAAGGKIRLNAAVTALEPGRVALRDGTTLLAARVVCALPFERAREVVDFPLRARDARFRGLERMVHSPIIGVHLRYSRPILARPHTVLVGRPTQWLFRKDDEGRRIHAVISGADEWTGLEPDAIVARVGADVQACLPHTVGAEIEWSRVVKERRATFAFTPEFPSLRPGPLCADDPGGLDPEPARRGVVLAGDYTAVEWPATMEAATRSGEAAAAAVLGAPTVESR